MLKRRISLGLSVVVACVFVLTGCGVEMIELTPEEHQKIVDYSAHVVGEFNTRLPKGYRVLSKETLESIGKENKKEETQTNNADSQVNQSQGSDNTGSVTTLTQALGIQGIVADNLSYKIVNDYVQDDVANIVPSKGKSLVLVECDLSNTSAEAVACDIYGMEMEFSIDVNSGVLSANSMITILDNDLSTLSETFEAGQSKKMVLLFEIPAEMTNSIETIALNVKNASTNHTISMN